MVHHLRQSALRNNLIGRVVGQQEYIVHRSNRLEQRRLVNQHARVGRQHNRHQCLDHL